MKITYDTSGECIGGDRQSWLVRGIVDKASRDRPCMDACAIRGKGGFEGRDEASPCDSSARMRVRG